MVSDDGRYCAVLVGNRKRYMPCGLPAENIKEQDGSKRRVCVFHARFRGRLPFRKLEL